MKAGLRYLDLILDKKNKYNKQKGNKMSQFYADIKGSAKTIATRHGGKTSGISGHVRGWESGIRVEGYHDEDLGDIFMVWQTSGSGFKSKSVLLGKLVGSTFNAIENT